jgi:hypothetical protein
MIERTGIGRPADKPSSTLGFPVLHRCRRKVHAMGRRATFIRSAGFDLPEPISFSADQWRALAEALGVRLDEGTRGAILMIADTYREEIAFRSMTPRKRDVLALLDRWVEAVDTMLELWKARGSRATQSEAAVEQYRRNTSDVAISCIARHFATFSGQSERATAPAEVLHTFSSTLGSLGAASLAAKLSIEKDDNSFLVFDDDPFEILVVELAKIVTKRHGITPSARKDYESYERISPFVAFVSKLAEFLGSPYRTPSAMSVAVAKALSNRVE